MILYYSILYYILYCIITCMIYCIRERQAVGVRCFIRFDTKPCSFQNQTLLLL